jgi:hypothetical protein
MSRKNEVIEMDTLYHLYEQQLSYVHNYLYTCGYSQEGKRRADLKITAMQELLEECERYVWGISSLFNEDGSISVAARDREKPSRLVGADYNGKPIYRWREGAIDCTDLPHGEVLRLIKENKHPVLLSDAQTNDAGVQAELRERKKKSTTKSQEK